MFSNARWAWRVLRGVERDMYVWVCPECGHYETEGGDHFTTRDGTCPVESVGGKVVHKGDAPKLERVLVTR